MTSVEPVLLERWEHAVWTLLRQLSWPSSRVSEVPLLEGMCDSDTGGQTSQVAFAHPQILRPELCNHVES